MIFFKPCTVYINIYTSQLLMLTEASQGADLFATHAEKLLTT